MSWTFPSCSYVIRWRPRFCRCRVYIGRAVLEARGARARRKVAPRASRVHPHRAPYLCFKTMLLLNHALPRFQVEAIDNLQSKMVYGLVYGRCCCFIYFLFLLSRKAGRVCNIFVLTILFFVLNSIITYDATPTLFKLIC